MIEFLKFNIGGYCGYTNVEIITEDSFLKIKSDSFPCLSSENETLISTQENETWINKLESLHINRWKSTYRLEDMVICDGEQWNLEYKEIGKRCRHISGDNAYPENWIDFLTVMSEIVPMDVPMQIDVFNFTYYGKGQLFTEKNLILQKTDLRYSEHIIIDRNKKSFVYNRILENGYEINNEYKTPSDISNLLDDLEEYFEDSTDYSFDFNDDANFTLCLNYHNGENRNIRSQYNRQCLPEYWEDVIKTIEQFISSYGFLGDAFNHDIYGKGVKENEIIYCTVNFNDSTKGFYYQTDDDTLVLGEKVIVPCGKENTKREATIKKIEYFKEDEAPFPVEKTKHIISRKENSNSNKEIKDILTKINTNKVKQYFATLLPANELSINKFHDDLFNMNCMLSHYYDYLEVEPMNVDEEMKRINSVDLPTAFAILTMVFREDHFSNGAIIGRIEDGTLDKIINKIKSLFYIL